MDFRALASKVAAEVGVDPAVFTRLVQNESSFNPNAKSKKGATGLAQLMPDTAQELGVDINDPEQNLRGGATYLKQQIDRFGSPELALAAYNAGPGAVQKAGGIPDFPETKSYVQKIMGSSDKLPTAKELWASFDVAGQTPNKGVTVFTPKNEPSDSTELPSAKELWATFGEEKLNTPPPVSKADVAQDVAKMGLKGAISSVMGATDLGGFQQDVMGRGMQSAATLGSRLAQMLGSRGLSQNDLTAIGQAPRTLGLSTMPSVQKAQASTQQFFGNPKTEQGTTAERVGSFAPAALTGPGGILSRGAQVIIPGLATDAAQRFTKGTPAEKYVPPLVAALTGMATAGGAAGLKNAATKALANRDLQTTEEIKNAGGNLYEQMKQEGVVVSKQRFDKFKNDLKSNLSKSGINHGLAKQSKESLDFILSKKGQIDFDELDLLRRNASRPFEAGSGASSNDKRVAGELVRSIDNFIQTLDSGTTGKAASLLKQGQQLWSKQAKSGMIEQEIEKAKANAGPMNVKLDDALRARFNKLSKDEKRMSQFTPEEQTAIKKVAKGGLVPDSLSVIGKLAPTSWASLIFNAAAMGGGYGAGQKLALASPAVGTAAKVVSTPLTLARALEASKTVRRGAPVARVNPKAGQAGAMAAYLANQQGQTQ